MNNKNYINIQGLEDIVKISNCYNSFETIQDLAKYMLIKDNNLTNQIIENYIVYESINDLQYSLNLILNLYKQYYNINFFENVNGLIFKTIQTEKDTGPEELPEVEISIVTEFSEISENDIYPFNLKTINKLILEKLNKLELETINKNLDYKKQLYSKNNIFYSRYENFNVLNNYLIVGGNSVYTFPIQIIIRKIFNKDGKMCFHGKIHLFQEANNYIFKLI